MHSPKPLQLASPVLVTNSVERGEKCVCCTRGLHKVPTNQCISIQGATPRSVLLCYQKIFVLIKICKWNCCRFLQRLNILFIFAFFRMYYRNYRDRNLNGANFTQMAKFLDQ